MNTRAPLPADPFDRIVRDAVRADMARIYGEERRTEPERRSTPRELQSIFSRRQAE